MIGKTKVNQIFIVLTPFHKKAFYSHYGEEMNQKNTLILKDQNIDDSLFLNYDSIILTIPYAEFSIFKFQNGFFKTVKNYRHQVKILQQFCDKLLVNKTFDENVTINIGTDRDVFTQIFLNKIYESKDLKPSLHAFDEGLGFYDTKRLTDKIKKIIYPLLSPILFNEKLKFYKPMGQDSRIDKVYCRFPELISKNGHSIYEKIHTRENNCTGTYNKLSNKTLVFSFPNQDLNIKEELKIEWISAIQELVKTEQIYVKFHPREIRPDPNTWPEVKNWTLIEDITMDHINYFDYKYIANFNSSIVMDLLASGYPADKIITIDFGSKVNISSLYNSTVKLKPNELKNADQIRL